MTHITSYGLFFKVVYGFDLIKLKVSVWQIISFY
jgi:hypothetical protein